MGETSTVEEWGRRRKASDKGEPGPRAPPPEGVDGAHGDRVRRGGDQPPAWVVVVAVVVVVVVVAVAVAGVAVFAVSSDAGA